MSWHDASDYAAWLSTQTGQHYRLPAEAEWQYAALGGTTTAYWWGDKVGTNRANCNGCGSQWDNKQTSPVGSFPANPWGLYDTAGNVWEWTCSVYGAKYDGAESHCAKLDDSGLLDLRVIRGGSWTNEPVFVRSATRNGNDPDDRDYGVGFRLAQD